MFNRRFKNSTYSVFLLGLSASLTLLFWPLAFPKPASAQTCPVFYNYGGLFPRVKTSENTSDITMNPDNFPKYTHSFSEGGYTVKIDSTISMRTSVFSQIFLNYYNMVGIFATTQVTEPALLNRWKTLCISRDGVGKGTVNISETGVIRYEKTTTKTYQSGETLPSDYSGSCDLDLDGKVDPGETCEITDTKPTDSRPINTAENGDVQIPYSNALRDIHRKIPSIISTDLRYCTPGSTEKNAICSAGYVCQEIPAADLSSYPDRDSNTGLCIISPTAQASISVPFPANILCSEDNTVSPTTTLPSKVCYDEPPKDPVYTQRRYATEDATTLSDPPKLPFLKEASIHAPTNEIEFDTEEGDLYYNEAFSNKLGLYSVDDANWMKNLPSQVRFSQSVKSETTMITSPYTTEDYVEKLGGYAEVANDARFLNPQNIPAGAEVVTAGKHVAYLRGGVEYKGALFVDGQPVGHHLNVAQHLPTIDSNYGQYAVAAIAWDNPDGINGLFVASTNTYGGQLQPIVRVSDSTYSGAPAIFILRNGEKIVFVQTGSSYKYIMSSNGSFKENSTLQTLLSNEVTTEARFAIDYEDNISVAWRKMCGTELCLTVNFAKLHYNATTNSLDTVMEPRQIPLSEEVGGLRGTIPYTIQTDNYGNVLLGVRMGNGKNNKLIFLSMNQAGNWSPEEIVTGRIKNKYEDEYESFSAGSAMPKIASFAGPLGSVTTAMVYSVYTGDEENHEIQMYYSLRLGDIGVKTAWTKPIPVSDMVDYRWQSRVTDESINKEGQIAFTVQEYSSKFNTNTKLFDAAGVKMCIVQATGVASLECGMNYDGSGVGYVLPPTVTSDKKMHVINPHTRQDML